MRALIGIVALVALLTAPALADNKGTAAMKSCAAAWKTMSATDKAKTTYKAYSTSCLKAGGPPPATTMSGPMTPQDRMKMCAAKWDAMKKDGTAKNTTYKAFSATCLKKT